MAWSQTSASGDFITDNEPNTDNNCSQDTSTPPKYDETQMPSSGYLHAYPPAYPTGQYGVNVANPGWHAYPQQQFQGYVVSPNMTNTPASDGRGSVSGGGHVIVIQQPAPVPVGKAFRCHMVAACLVFWFCGWGFGGIAFALAVVARSSLSAGRAEEARKLGLASAWVIVAALITGLIAWAFIVWAVVAAVLEEN